MTAAVQERETIAREIRTAVRHMAVYGLGNVLVKALGFLMLPFYTHYLAPKDYGILEILDLSMSLFALILNMGLTPAFLRCYAAADSTQEKRRVVSTGCLFGLATGLLTFAAGSGLVRPATRLLFGAGVPATYVFLSFTGLVLNYMANLPRTYLRALEKSGAFTMIDTANVFLLLMLNVIFIAGLKLGLAGVLWSSVITGALQFVLLSAWAFRRAGLQFRRTHLRRMLAFGLPLIFANLGLFVLNFSDRFFLQHLRSLDVVGVYAVGYKFGYMMNYVFVQPFFVMWQSRMYAIHERPEHRNIFRQVFLFYSLGLIFVGLGMSLFSDNVVRRMVEAKFAASSEVIPIVVLAYIFYGLSYYAQLGMFLTDRTRMIGVLGAGAALLNLVLNYFMISRWGMMGAAWATVLSFAAIAAASYWCSQRVFRLPLNIGRMTLALALAAGFYALSRWVNPQWTAAGLLARVALLAVFPWIIWKAGILPASEAETLISARDSALARISRLMSGVFGRAGVVNH
jgi:O-antigen/teichoic acid export membrane protein